MKDFSRIEVLRWRKEVIMKDFSRIEALGWRGQGILREEFKR